MPVALFLDPETERVDDSDGDLFQQIADAHADGDREAESGEALEGLATLRLYEEQQQDGSRDLFRTLNRLDRELRGRRANQGAQKQIDSYFRP
jgi:hypothetical protein